MDFSIEIKDGWAKIGFFLHPQIGNFFMRFGLPAKERIEMEFLHEFGHVQGFPLVLVYYIPFLLSKNITGNFILITVGMLMFWEIIAEIYVIKNFERYFEVYKTDLKPVTLIFWFGVLVITLYPFFCGDMRLKM